MPPPSPPSPARHIPYTSTRIIVYELLRDWWAEQRPAGPEGKASVPLYAKLCMGATAGMVGQLISVPADLIKVRMQADGRLMAAGKLAQPRYRGMADAARQIVAAEGVVGLWRGVGPAVQRAGLVNLGE